MGHAKFVIIIVFLIGFVTLLSTETVHATDASQHKKMLEKVDSLSLILNDKFRTDMKTNWNATSQSQQYTITNIVKSLEKFEEIYQHEQ